MQKKINKLLWMGILIFLLCLACYFIYDEASDKKSLKDFDQKIYYMNTYIYMKVYSTDSSKAQDALKEAEKMYKKYHELSDRFNGYPGLKNIYYIAHNTEDAEWIEIDPKLYDMLSLAVKWHEKTNGLFDVSMGNVIDVWKRYRDQKSGVPTVEELEQAHTQTIADIVLEDGKIKNTHVNIDLGGIAKGYVTQKVGEYFESVGLSRYLINAGGNVLVGKAYNSDSYKIGIEDPTSNESNIYTKIKTSNMSVVTSGSYERFYEYEGKKYHHIISPKTLFPPDEFMSVTVICEDATMADILATTVFLMDLEEGKEYIDSLEGVEAIWYVDKDQQVMSNGFAKYQYE